LKGRYFLNSHFGCLFYTIVIEKIIKKITSQ
jgi:hypothetical protein